MITTKQKKLLVIEQMGRDLLNLMNNIDEFRKSFRSLTKTVDEILVSKNNM
jgi:hypothetical protein